jgi:electron transport complex protein RnfD
MPERKPALTHKPQINISYPSTGRMWLVCGCAFLCVLQSAASDGGKSFFVSLTALLSALTIEILLTWKKTGFMKIIDGSAAATAMTLSLLLPNEINPLYAALGAAFAITVVKYSFGGLGSNWLNPALGGWLFIRFSWPAAFAKAMEGSNVSIAELISNQSSALDNSVTTFFNKTVFSATSAHLPSGYIDLLFSNQPGLIADRGLFALLIGTVAITAVGISRSWGPPLFLFVFSFLTRLAGDKAGELWNGDMLYGIFTGGTVAAAFILASEPASGAQYKPGILFAIIAGAFLSWVFRYRCLDFSGCFIALALVNCLTPLIRFFELKFLTFRERRGNPSEGIS